MDPRLSLDLTSKKDPSFLASEKRKEVHADEIKSLGGMA